LDAPQNIQKFRLLDSIMRIDIQQDQLGAVEYVGLFIINVALDSWLPK
jgi:hypothetical protein